MLGRAQGVGHDRECEPFLREEPEAGAVAHVEALRSEPSRRSRRLRSPPLAFLVPPVRQAPETGREHREPHAGLGYQREDRSARDLCEMGRLRGISFSEGQPADLAVRRL